MGDKTPASFAEYAVIKPARGRPAKRRIAEVQPVQEEQGQPQQQEQVEHDDLSAALAIPGLPALPDFGAAVRQFMLGDGTKLSIETSSTFQIKLFSTCWPRFQRHSLSISTPTPSSWSTPTCLILGCIRSTRTSHCLFIVTL